MPGGPALLPLLREPRAIAMGLAAGLATALAIAIPAAVLANPFFVRMTPVRPLDIVLLALTALLAGLLGATYARPGVAAPAGSRGGVGGILALLAIGCPVCNKIVVALLGVSGALAYFEPIQPLLGVAGLILLFTAFRLRLRSLAACEVRLLRSSA